MRLHQHLNAAPNGATNLLAAALPLQQQGRTPQNAHSANAATATILRGILPRNNAATAGSPVRAISATNAKTAAAISANHRKQHSSHFCITPFTNFLRGNLPHHITTNSTIYWVRSLAHPFLRIQSCGNPCSGTACPLVYRFNFSLRLLSFAED